MTMAHEAYENTLDDTYWVEKVISYTVTHGTVLDWPVGDRFMKALQGLSAMKDATPEDLERVRRLGYDDQRQRRSRAVLYS